MSFLFNNKNKACSSQLENLYSRNCAFRNKIKKKKLYYKQKISFQSSPILNFKCSDILKSNHETYLSYFNPTAADLDIIRYRLIKWLKEKSKVLYILSSPGTWNVDGSSLVWKAENKGNWWRFQVCFLMNNWCKRVKWSWSISNQESS